jgi:hypothetical protein
MFGGIFNTRSGEYLKQIIFLNLCLDISLEIYDYSVLRSDQFVAAVDRTTWMMCHGQPYTYA